jgi:hypothetical protein
MEGAEEPEEPEEPEARKKRKKRKKGKMLKNGRKQKKRNERKKNFNTFFRGPYSAVYFLWRYGRPEPNQMTPIWALAAGGVGIVLGLAIFGRPVMETIGKRKRHKARRTEKKN